MVIKRPVYDNGSELKSTVNLGDSIERCDPLAAGVLLVLLATLVGHVLLL
jgi:hypothetical protein